MMANNARGAVILLSAGVNSTTLTFTPFTYNQLMTTAIAAYMFIATATGLAVIFMQDDHKRTTNERIGLAIYVVLIGVLWPLAIAIGVIVKILE